MANENIRPRVSKSSRETFSEGTTYLSARVRDIILDNTHPLFRQYGEWNSIGVVFFESAKNPIFSKNTDLIAAYPLFPNVKHYPLINELVYIVYLADADVTQNTTVVAPYYFPPINVWNSQTHNAIPSSDILPKSQKRDYVQAEAGSVRRVTDQSTEINLGTTFNEDNVIDVHPLLPYEGDIIYEGRFGNSIRLGSTVTNAWIKNPWSYEGKNGDPIFILRNGQPNNPNTVGLQDDPWVPIIENINDDKSSIYLTSTQRIHLQPASNLTDSYNKSTEIPANPAIYSRPQIILNSGRLVFNAKNDHIILGADKSIHLTANTTVNMDAQEQIAMVAPKVYLGSTNGAEGIDIQSVVLGENLVRNLKSLIISLQGVADAMATATAGPFPVASLIDQGPRLLGVCNDIKANLEKGEILSKIVKTK